MKSFFLMLIIVIVFLTSCSNQQSGWLTWRGPNGDGISTETKWDPLKLDPTNILWKKNIGFGHSAFTVQGNNCFVTGWSEKISGKDTIGEGAIYCLNVQTGDEVWKYTYPSANRSFPGPRSTPVIDGNFLYAISWQGVLFCIDAKNGKEKWQTNLTSDSTCLVGQWGVCPSPVICNELILLDMNKSGIAINKNTGKVIWNSELKDAHYSSVKLIKYQNKTAGVFMCDSMINIVEPASGKVLLTYDKDSDKSMENDIMVSSDGKLFTSDELLAFEGTSLKSVWKNDTISSYFRVGVLMGDYAYQFSDNKNKAPLVCVDVRTGVPSWSVNLGRFGAVTAVGNKLIVVNGTGKVLIADAKPNGYNLIKELQVLPSEDIEKNWCWTAPTFCDGKLFVRNSCGDIACLNLGI